VTRALTTVTLDPTTDPRWTQLLAGRPADVFHSPPWLRALRDTYDLPIEATVLTDTDGVPVAGFVYAPIDDIMDPRVVSLPFSDFCDPLVSTPAEWAAVTDGVLTPDRRVHVRCLHSELPLADPRLEPAGRARWHAVDLRRDLDDIWASIASPARRSIRKARDEGVQVRVAESVEDVRSFFELHLHVRKRKYQLLAQPWPFFEQLWTHLLSQGHGRLQLAERDGQVLGGVLLLQWGRTLYYKFNASQPDLLGARPNDLVIWAAIEHGVASGLEKLDFGLSDWDQEGLLRFKRKYATEEKTIHSLRQVPQAPSPRELELRALLPRLTSLLTDPEVPDRLSEEGGNLLYRYFT
jgi:CelD/BcsL family acetyltransferase involved in cellulose biosynthesis